MLAVYLLFSVACFLTVHEHSLAAALTDEDAIGEHDRHPGEVCADIKPDREIGDAFRHLEYFLIVHSNILSGRHPIPKGGYTT